ncbi:DUF2780 domain-containing protein [Agaribacter marinus]|uniref:DUF2780 domain-containing protein n=1 Tax=Agaribacter marinus TaxID=1431249 RepID=A0AA37SXP9_9ALTE|nr:DUF2780 domain-containing protein [Agaribacter marinus]GLR70972.1 hypothetical protein GCM10007852_18800 [Agaribacter marinus]
MRKTFIFCATLLLSNLALSTNAVAEESWFNSLLNAVGLGDSASDEVEQVLPSAQGLLTHLTSNLDVTKPQAEGGMAALLNYAKQNISTDDFSALAKQIPGLDGLSSALPEVSDAAGGNLSGILDAAANYNESLAALNDLRKQFESLGLDTEMIMGFVKQAQAYLDTEEGQQAKQMLSNALQNLKLGQE